MKRRRTFKGRKRRVVSVCRYCGHTRRAHDLHDITQPPPSKRCRVCPCPSYINTDGRPDWLVNVEAAKFVAKVRAIVAAKLVAEKLAEKAKA